MIARFRFPTGRRPALQPVICGVLCGIAATYFTGTSIAAPFTEATVTRIENLVDYGEMQGGNRRPAVVADIITPNRFLLTKTDSRAELKYGDGSLVRIGQNTVFSFDADTRTLSLEKGTFMFYVPKGTGGGKIKTPSLAAAITGTVGKVSENTIAILEGEVTLIPSGRIVRAGFFARRNPDETITIARFDFGKAWEGKLVWFNGPMPGMPEIPEERRLIALDLRELRTAEILNRTNASPSAIKKFFPQDPPAPPRPQESEPVVEPTPTPLPPPPQPAEPPLRD